MYTAFIEVIKDLWIFVSSHRVSLSASQEILLLAETSTAQTQSSETAQAAHTLHTLENRVCYATESAVNCLQRPQKKFDTLRGVLEYGQSVRVVHHKNKWSFVESAAVQGWIETRYLTDDQQMVFPQWSNGEAYDADNIETKKLRSCLNDELLGDLLKLPLQPSEYIMYRLKRLGIRIAWPLERPRLPGMWQSILNGKKGISIGFEPKTGSVLECANDQERFLAFVESVTPDESIDISCVGRREDGVYEKNTYDRAQWRRWRPVFISLT